MRNIGFALVLAMASLLAACGQGGGDQTADNPNGGQVAPTPKPQQGLSQAEPRLTP